MKTLRHLLLILVFFWGNVQAVSATTVEYTVTQGPDQYSENAYSFSGPLRPKWSYFLTYGAGSLAGDRFTQGEIGIYHSFLETWQAGISYSFNTNNPKTTSIGGTLSNQATEYLSIQGGIQAQNYDYDVFKSRGTVLSTALSFTPSPPILLDIAYTYYQYPDEKTIQQQLAKQGQRVLSSQVKSLLAGNTKGTLDFQGTYIFSQLGYTQIYTGITLNNTLNNGTSTFYRLGTSIPFQEAWWLNVQYDIASGNSSGAYSTYGLSYTF